MIGFYHIAAYGRGTTVVEEIAYNCEGYRFQESDDAPALRVYYELKLYGV